MDKKTCVGCGTLVARPVLCNSCGIASHPGCIARSGHLHSGGKFLDCETSPINSSGPLLSRIEDILRNELALFREEMKNMYRADMERIMAEIRDQNSRIAEIEKKILSPGSDYEDLIEEIGQREAKSSNLIFFNLEEADPASAPEQISDGVVMEEIVRLVQPRDPPVTRVRRLGRARPGYIRPLLVSFASKTEAIGILKNKNVYSGPAIIKQDLTRKQREHLAELRNRLESLKNSGRTDMTIRYINGTPKIVKNHHNVKSKNVPAL